MTRDSEPAGDPRPIDDCEEIDPALAPEFIAASQDAPRGTARGNTVFFTKYLVLVPILFFQSVTTGGLIYLICHFTMPGNYASDVVWQSLILGFTGLSFAFSFSVGRVANLLKFSLVR